jgi:hypothetical protein|tara:strand:- start:300 stop:551 length:252 start_codon:yes stop_codon:yes gene_type:complete
MYDISDTQLIDLSRFIRNLPQYRIKELIVLVSSTTLGLGSVKTLAKTMVALSEVEAEVEKKEHELAMAEEEMNKQNQWAALED